MTEETQPGPSLFRVEFHDGRRITLAAPIAIIAEAKACRQHPGFVKSVTYLGKVKR